MATVLRCERCKSLVEVVPRFSGAPEVCPCGGCWRVVGSDRPEVTAGESGSWRANPEEITKVDPK
jgi:hypothetical protein